MSLDELVDFKNSSLDGKLVTRFHGDNTYARGAVATSDILRCLLFTHTYLP